MALKHVYLGFSHLFKEALRIPDFLSIKAVRADFSEAGQLLLFQAISPFIHSVCPSASSIHPFIHSYTF